jgi:hypothetical protein
MNQNFRKETALPLKKYRIYFSLFNDDSKSQYIEIRAAEAKIAEDMFKKLKPTMYITGITNQKS